MQKVVCCLMCLCALGISSCSDDYDDTEVRADIKDLEDRVAALEVWQKTVNTNIQSLQSLVSALESKNFITGVTPVMESGKEVGYTITFQTGGSITINHGKDGDKGADGKPGLDGKPAVAPVIGVAQDTDGLYYWTLDGEFLKGTAGDKIPVTGSKGDDGEPGLTPHVGDNGNWWIGTTDTGIKAQGEAGLTPHVGDNGNWWIGTTDTGVKAAGEKGADAIAPQVRINTETNEWELSTDDGATWTSLHVKATGDKGERGDAIFAEDGVDYTSDPDNVVFTLADGTTRIIVPRASTLGIAFKDGCGVADITGELKFELVFTGLTKEKYNALVAEVKWAGGTADRDILTRAYRDVEIVQPEFDADGKCGGTSLWVANTKGLYSGTKGVLKVTLIDNDGKEVSVSRAVRYFNSELAYAANTGGEVTLTEDIVLTEQIAVAEGKTLVLDLNGKKLSTETDIWNTAADKWSMISVQGGTLILKNGSVIAKANDAYGIDVRDGGKLVIESGTYVGNMHAVYVNKGTAEIKGGTFSVLQKFSAQYPDEYVINCYDSSYKNGTASIRITGGRFVGFNPAYCRAEGEGTNFVADGYCSKIVSEATDQMPAVYEVTQVEPTTTADAFVKAIAAEASSIVLGADVEMDTLKLTKTKKIDLNGKSLTAAKIVLPSGGGKSDVVLSNGTIVVGNDATENKDKIEDGIKLLTNGSSLTLDGVTVDASRITNIAISCGVTGDKGKDMRNNTVTIRNSTINSAANGIQLDNIHTLIVSNSKINHGWFGIAQNGTIAGSEIRITDTDISGLYSGIYLSNQASGAFNKLTVTGGHIHSQAESAIEVKKTNLIVENAVLSSDVTTQKYVLNAGGSGGEGYGIVLAGYAKGTPYEGDFSMNNVTFDLKAAGEDVIEVLKYDGTNGVEYQY